LSKPFPFNDDFKKQLGKSNPGLQKSESCPPEPMAIMAGGVENCRDEDGLGGFHYLVNNPIGKPVRVTPA
jgi:hypothetical protein